MKSTHSPLKPNLIVNTSNPSKQEEFTEFLRELSYSVTFTHKDLREIEAPPFTVIAHKASQFDTPVLVEDTSLHIEGEDIGIKIRWLLDKTTTLIGKRAIWTVLLGLRNHDRVNIYQGKTHGKIVAPRGEGFGFDPIFQPEGSMQTLGEAKPKKHNARWHALVAMKNEDLFTQLKTIENWDGKWQK